MPYARKIILKLPMGNPSALAAFVEDCLRDKVELIAVTGPGCQAIHDLIDDLIIGDGSAERFILTSWHTDESFDEVLKFASDWGAESEGRVQVVGL